MSSFNQDDSLLSSNWVSISVCVLYLLCFALNTGITFSSACIYSTLWIKDFRQSLVGGGSSTDRSLSALPTGRTHPFKLSDDGPNPYLALLNHPLFPQNFLSFPLWNRSLFWVLLHTLMWRVKPRLPCSSLGRGEEQEYSASGTSGRVLLSRAYLAGGWYWHRQPFLPGAFHLRLNMWTQPQPREES